MKRYVASVLVVLASALAPSACVAARPAAVNDSPPSSADRAGQRGPFLWQVRRGSAVSYAFGTIHTGVTLDEVSSLVHEKFASCDTLIVETDTRDPAALARYTVLPPDESLHSLLGERYWNKLVAGMRNRMPETMLDRFRPWVVGIMIALDDLLYSEEPGLDGELVQLAEEGKKRLVFLEKVGEQLELLDDVLGLESLKEVLDDVTAARQNLRAMIRAYRTGNLEAIAGLTFDPEEVARYPERYEAMLYARNRVWMDKLRPHFDRGSVFLAVGTGHYIGGSKGLLGLLRAAGYEVQRLGTRAPSR